MITEKINISGSVAMTFAIKTGSFAVMFDSIEVRAEETADVRSSPEPVPTAPQKRSN